MKKIIIDNCSPCPHRYHRICTSVNYIPKCSLSNKDLPYTEMNEKLGGFITAIPTNEIPDWCQLKDN